ncbi:hypothetical protein [Ornithinimicrobium sp. INDO-MA30-4]|uniref:hypothetical protein n=1 Tax=Ornithinimicrobium sp. INDO-MA30-4 TaxID=2908651 RepID=UPI001F29A562|nr:hypothetical protein [Ornithinimicrobium sp. INDO-MA30-4]UJH70360.1 hypothetical protein L0A91_14690 [Ornithinimicrobium sp. INDO-MA30-4]
MFWAAIAVTVSIVDIELGVSDTTAACVHLLALAVFFGAVALAVGAATGRTDLALGVAGGFAVLSYLVKSMLPLANLDSWAQISPWYYYSGGNPLVEGINFVHLAVLGTLTVIALLVAYRTFATRDLKG